MLRKLRLDWPADHHLDQLLAGESPDLVTGNHFAIPKHHDAIGYFKYLVEAMADVNNAEGVRLQIANDGKEVLHLLRAKRRRRFIHDEDSGVDGKRLGDLDLLLLGHRKLPATGVRVDRQPDLLEQLQCVPSFLGGVDQAPLRSLPAEKNILTHSKIGNEIELLINDRHSGTLGRARRGYCAGWPSRRSVPLSGRWAPPSTLISVLLPAPFSPTRARTSPRRNSSDTSFNAWTPGNRLSIPRISKRGAARFSVSAMIRLPNRDKLDNHAPPWRGC